jgi:hypothetical protein
MSLLAPSRRSPWIHVGHHRKLAPESVRFGPRVHHRHPGTCFTVSAGDPSRTEGGSRLRSPAPRRRQKGYPFIPRFP